MVRVIVLCMQIYFEFWKMEEGPVEKLWHIAFANFSEIRRLYITQNGKFSLLFSLISIRVLSSLSMLLINPATYFLATMMIEIEAENS
ncbi:hypothetical protein T09_4886, partial [Trichinella sp. T9]